MGWIDRMSEQVHQVQVAGEGHLECYIVYDGNKYMQTDCENGNSNCEKNALTGFVMCKKNTFSLILEI